jgi:photoactive yellow protein
MLNRAPLEIEFDNLNLFAILASLSSADLDKLPFGVIGFDGEGVICIYNAPEARWAGLDRDNVIGSPMFEVVAPCMNNYLIAERFGEASERHEALDATLDYVLTLRMRPTPCTLRLLTDEASRIRFILIKRK